MYVRWKTSFEFWNLQISPTYVPRTIYEFCSLTLNCVNSGISYGRRWILVRKFEFVDVKFRLKREQNLILRDVGYKWLQKSHTPLVFYVNMKVFNIQRTVIILGIHSSLHRLFSNQPIKYKYLHVLRHLLNIYRLLVTIHKCSSKRKQLNNLYSHEIYALKNFVNSFYTSVFHIPPKVLSSSVLILPTCERLYFSQNAFEPYSVPYFVK